MTADWLLYLAPAILLLVTLASGHYPGERLLEAVARVWHRAPRRTPSVSTRPLAPPRSSPRGGVLLAMALAGRGPPGVSSATRAGGTHLWRTVNERKR
jgi:hypothetical protein